MLPLRAQRKKSEASCLPVRHEGPSTAMSGVPPCGGREAIFDRAAYGRHKGTTAIAHISPADTREKVGGKGTKGGGVNRSGRYGPDTIAQ